MPVIFIYEGEHLCCSGKTFQLLNLGSGSYANSLTNLMRDL